MSSISGFYADSVVGDLLPPAQATHWRVDRPDPHRYKHKESGVYKPSAKVSLVGGFSNQSITLNTLDFGNTNLTTSGYFDSDTIALTMNMGEVNSNVNSYFYNMSGIMENVKLFNVRFWMSNKTAFSGLDVADFYYTTSQDWTRGTKLTRDTAGIALVPSSIPSTPNVYAGDNNIFVSGIYNKTGYTYYIYLFGSFSGINATLGTYGNASSGNFRFRISYDWSTDSANILNTDY